MAVLRTGSKGEQVEALQKQLQGAGFNPGSIDGVFGPKTEAALKRFQEKAGLEADGIAGAKTFTALVKKSGTPGAKTKKTFSGFLGRRKPADKESPGDSGR